MKTLEKYQKTVLSRCFVLLLTMLAAACQSSTTLEGDNNYAAVDAYSASVYPDLVELLHHEDFAKSVEAAAALPPGTFAAKYWETGTDGKVQFDGTVYDDVLLAQKHSPYMASNIKFLEKKFGSMAALFKSFDLSEGSAIGAADLQLYFRFTADALSAGGFTNEAAQAAGKYSPKAIMNVVRTSIFVAQMAEAAPAAEGSALELTGRASNQVNNTGGQAAMGIQLTGIATRRVSVNLQLVQSTGTLTGTATNRCPPGSAGTPSCMAPDAPTQCYNTHSAGSHPVAGVDNTTFGSGNDGTNGGGTNCGKCLTVTSDKASVTFVIADRIWQNGGTSNLQPTDGSKPPTSASTQFDLDPDAFNQLFPNPGPNPTVTASFTACTTPTPNNH